MQQGNAGEPYDRRGRYRRTRTPCAFADLEIRSACRDRWQHIVSVLAPGRVVRVVRFRRGGRRHDVVLSQAQPCRLRFEVLGDDVFEFNGWVRRKGFMSGGRAIRRGARAIDFERCGRSARPLAGVAVVAASDPLPTSDGHRLRWCNQVAVRGAFCRARLGFHFTPIAIAGLRTRSVG